MRIIQLAKLGGVQTIPDFLRDANRRDRLMLVSDAEFASIPTSGVMADEILEPAESLVSAAGVLSSSATVPIGYSTGAGGAVTQITTSATGVTLSKPCGQITTVALTTAGAAEEKFTVTNTLVDANDVIVLGTTYNGAGQPMLSVSNTAASAFDIVITNVSASALNAVMVINFVVIKSVVA